MISFDRGGCAVVCVLYILNLPTFIRVAVIDVALELRVCLCFFLLSFSPDESPGGEFCFIV